MENEKRDNMKYCNNENTCRFFNFRRAKCEIANWPVKMVGGGHIDCPRHLFARIPNCFLTREEGVKEKFTTEGDGDD